MNNHNLHNTFVLYTKIFLSNIFFNNSIYGNVYCIYCVIGHGLCFDNKIPDNYEKKLLIFPTCPTYNFVLYFLEIIILLIFTESYTYPFVNKLGMKCAKYAVLKLH